MRRLLALTVIALSALGLAVAINPAGARAAQRVSPTQRIVVRPVTTAGVARTGFVVTPEPTGSVDCTLALPSPGAVSRNIESCFPSFEYAIACWKAAAPHKVLCMRNPRLPKLVRIPRTGAFAGTPVAPARDRAPLSMVLGDGAYCTLRDGGTRSHRAGHPRWVVTYDCDNGKEIWRRPGAPHFGVNELHPSWTVIEAGPSGPINTRHVVRAWFVGTFTG